MSKIYKSIDNKPEPVIILAKAETTVPASQSWDWSSYTKVPYYMPNITKGNEEKLIIPFYVLDSNKKHYNLLYTTYGGGGSLDDVADLGHCINFAGYKSVMNTKQVFRDYFTQAQINRGWNNYACAAETNNWGPGGGCGFGYGNGYIHFLNFGTNNELYYNPEPFNVNISTDWDGHKNGSSITVNNVNFTLGFNGIISGAGLSNYFNNIQNQKVYNQWMVLGIKGGNKQSITFTNTACCNIKFYALNESDNDVQNYLLKKREIQTDIWYVEDDNFKTFGTNDAYYDKITICKINQYMGDNTSSYYNGSPYSYDVGYWVDNVNQATVFQSTSQAQSLLNSIPTARYTTFTITDNTISHINVSQPLAMTASTFSLSQSTVSGYVITAKSGTNNVIYSGSSATYQSTAWGNYTDVSNGRYFSTNAQASNIKSHIGSEVSNANVYKSPLLAAFGDHKFETPPFKFLTLNYFIKPV